MKMILRAVCQNDIQKNKGEEKMKAKKLFPVIITAFLLTVTALSGFAGCAQDDEEPTYDVAIKIANNYENTKK